MASCSKISPPKKNMLTGLNDQNCYWQSICSGEIVHRASFLTFFWWALNFHDLFVTRPFFCGVVVLQHFDSFLKSFEHIIFASQNRSCRTSPVLTMLTRTCRTAPDHVVHGFVHRQTGLKKTRFSLNPSRQTETRIAAAIVPVGVCNPVRTRECCLGRNLLSDSAGVHRYLGSIRGISSIDFVYLNTTRQNVWKRTADPSFRSESSRCEAPIVSSVTEFTTLDG